MRVLGCFYLSSSWATKLKVETWLVLETTFLTGRSSHQMGDNSGLLHRGWFLGYYLVLTGPSFTFNLSLFC